MREVNGAWVEGQNSAWQGHTAQVNAIPRFGVIDVALANAKAKSIRMGYLNSRVERFDVRHVHFLVDVFVGVTVSIVRLRRPKHWFGIRIITSSLLYVLKQVINLNLGDEKQSKQLAAERGGHLWVNILQDIIGDIYRGF